VRFLLAALDQRCGTDAAGTGDSSKSKSTTRLVSLQIGQHAHQSHRA
jgi:hypothetical protein